ncbi:VOC family protein [Streptomyces sp. cg28]|uniref:VOC family protein n=1 Tax=Streptomyces sp. cg28 TaxID=3403457 RepID=UPI003B220867
MTLNWEQVVVHTADPAALGRWWAEALGWVVTYTSDDEFEIRPEADRTPGIDFVRADEVVRHRGRLHLDFRPADQAAEVARLEALGARRVDIGQGEQPWVVLADPEGNEFCVLAARGGE